jgi:YYY domain-containing protein
LANGNSSLSRRQANPKSSLPITNLYFTAAAGARPAGVIDKLQEILQNSWSHVLQAVGGRLAFGLYALYLGSLSFLNTWDFPIYLGVVGLALIAWLSRWHSREAASGPKTEKLSFQPGFILSGVAGTVLLGVVGVLLYLPFYATFQSQARGILPNLWNPTRLPQFVVFFGPFLFAVIGLLLALSFRRRGWQKYLSSTLALTILGPVVMMLLALSALLFSSTGREYVQGILNSPDVQQVLGATTIGALMQASLWRRLLDPWTFVGVGGLLGWALALFVRNLEDRPVESEAADLRSPVSTSEQFALILVLVGLVLPLSVEFIYLRDNFGIRMNTIFKFYFQAWVLLALASAFGVYYVSKYSRGPARLAWLVGLALLVAGGMVYPVLATPNKADFFQNPPRLDGMAWIADYRPGDYAAITWLRENAPPGAVILEAPAPPPDAYQYTSRISALTGLPTVLGWGGHQGQWRGNYDEASRRVPDIEQLYNTTDIRQAQALLDKYGITYVVVGALERERYAPRGLDKFARLMEVAFQQDEVIIYRRQ